MLVESFAGGVVIYRTAGSEWLLAPQVGDRVGFDVDSPTAEYAVAVVDVANGRVDAIYTTLSEDADVRFYAADRVDGPKHVVSGTVTGIGPGLLGGLVAGRGGDQFLQGDESSRPFSLEVDEGLQTIAFARSESGEFGQPFTTISLVVHRDLAITGPLTLDADLSEGIPTISVPLASRSSCLHVSTFSFGDTQLLLSEIADPPTLVAPAPDQWRPGDRLTLSLRCGGRLNYRERTREMTRPDLLVTEVAPPQALGQVTFSPTDNSFAWPPYDTSPVVYHAVIAGAPCLASALQARQFLDTSCRHRWTARATEGWTTARGHSIQFVAKSDLERLGLWDPAFELEAPMTWSVSAVVDHDDGRSFAAVGGEVTP